MQRILRSLYAVGADPIRSPLPVVDVQTHTRQALAAARNGRSLPCLVGLRDGGWHRPSGRCAFGIGHRDSALGLRVSVALPQRRWRP